MPVLNDALRNEYQRLFDTCVIRTGTYNRVDTIVKKILAGRPTYELIAGNTGVPWFFTGVVHNMESGCDFSRHLHNGDPLAARTVHVPKGYPKKGNPPFTFTESAEDALALEGFVQWTDWSIPGMLYSLERYNGFGYRSKGINTPYLWSGSNQYTKGKYVSDGKFDPNAVSTQIGAAVLLRRMSELQVALAGTQDTVSLIKALGPHVRFDPAQYNPDAERLQKMLNSIGQHLRVDGQAGRNTSDAYQRLTGTWLPGDPMALQPHP